ncbi:hypothetical protein AVEN_150307-1 [Araneus ventricosus]|uniref:Uncharacterized protein n=1 Tax=Araneus ventricosus TaxID=182803 RepID=A0A4Y2HRG0_ARAVE|nr:hypothetical protein AVEN_150307-1 [Araneus ventricosus]
MAGIIDVSAKCKLRSVILFLQAEGWFVENDYCSCFCQTLRLQRAILTSGVALTLDNSRPHSVVVIQQLLERLNGTRLITRRIAPT